MTALLLLSETISGPPESPWHESFPPLCTVYRLDSKFEVFVSSRFDQTCAIAMLESFNPAPR